jgi:hypothetical protein
MGRVVANNALVPGWVTNGEIEESQLTAGGAELLRAIRHPGNRGELDTIEIKVRLLSTRREQMRLAVYGRPAGPAKYPTYHTPDPDAYMQAAEAMHGRYLDDHMTGPWKWGGLRTCRGGDGSKETPAEYLNRNAAELFRVADIVWPLQKAA